MPWSTQAVSQDWSIIDMIVVVLMLALVAVVVLVHTTKILPRKNKLDTKLPTKSAQNQITTGSS